jgi:hypothetical protein
VWTCEECNLNFTSSQALGGHKATSLEHRQRQDSKKEKETKPSQPVDYVLVDGPLTEVWGGGCSLMTDSHENADAERPMRRKRMLADDSRFALQLHHEELKATRVQKVAVHGAAKAEGTAGKKVKKGMVGEAGVEVGRRTWGVTGGETTAMKKTSKTDGTESDSEVEDLSRAVHLQEQSGKQCKKPVSSGLTRVALSQRLQAGLACDSCRQKHIRCVHMAAVAAAPLSNLTTHSCQQQHPEQQSAFSQVSASTNCHSSIGQMGDGVLNRFLGMEGGILLGREQELVAPHHSAPPPVAAPVMWQSRTARSLASSVSPSKSLQSSEKSCGSQSSTSVPSTALDPVRQVVNGGAAWLVGGSCSLVQPVAESAGVLVNEDTGSGNKSRLSNNVTLKRARESHDGIGQSLAQLDFDHLGKDCKACDNCRQKHIRCVHLAAAAEPRKRGRVDAVARQDGSHSNPIESSTIDMNSDNGDNGANVVAPALTLQVAKTPVPSRRTRSAFTTT